MHSCFLCMLRTRLSDVRVPVTPHRSESHHVAHEVSPSGFRVCLGRRAECLLPGVGGFAFSLMIARRVAEY